MIPTGRRRSGGSPSGYKLTVPADEMTRYGMGYPITCELALPTSSGPAVAQWRRTANLPWSTIGQAPQPRFNGITAARRDGDRLLVSLAFPEDHPEMHVRAVDVNGDEVGTWVGVTENYDDRSIALIVTYDDNPPLALWEASTSTHQGAGVWMSPGLVPSRWGDEYDGSLFGARHVEAATRAGYVEPINHSWSHVNMMSSTDQPLADSEVGLARDALVSLELPPQSRGRSHGYIYPYGSYPLTVRDALARFGYLSGRLVADHNWSASQGTYDIAEIDPTYGIITGQMPSVAPLNGAIQVEAPAADQSAAAAKALAAIDHARTNGLPMVHIYAYIRHYSWGAADPWPQMLATAGAPADVWSVGYGHHALYHRTRDKLTVTPMSI